MIILGISDNHDSGACLVKDGEIVAAINEERLKRDKLIGGFPYLSIEEVLRTSGVSSQDLDFIVFASSMTPSFLLRLLDDFHNNLRKNKSSFSYLLNLYIIGQVFAYKLRIPKVIERILSTEVMKRKLDRLNIKAPVICIDHHYAHAASSYYTSGEKGKVLILTADAMGDGLSVTVNIGKERDVKRIFSQTAFSSIGTYYSRLTEFLGFKPLRNEGKITALAGHGAFDREILILAKCYFRFLKERGAFNLKNYLLKESMNDGLHIKLKRYSREDIAYNFQKNFEEEITRFVKFWVGKTGIRGVSLAGGIFANIMLNKRISRIKQIERLYIFPHMGDGGLSLGAALGFLRPKPIYFKNIYLGPVYSDGLIKERLDKVGLSYSFLREDELCNKIAHFLFEGKTIAHFNGRMEYGPRALGNRSILYRADDPTCKDWLNEKLKRSHFMPFAPVSLAEESERLYLDIDKISYTLRFMNIAVECSREMKEISPGAVHINGTARPQILFREDNPRLYKILQIYKSLKGTSTIINTSFNSHEEPIVCSPEDAIKSFLSCNLDYLVLNNFLVWRREGY